MRKIFILIFLFICFLIFADEKDLKISKRISGTYLFNRDTKIAFTYSIVEYKGLKGFGIGDNYWFCDYWDINKLITEQGKMKTWIVVTKTPLHEYLQTVGFVSWVVRYDSITFYIQTYDWKTETFLCLSECTIKIKDL